MTIGIFGGSFNPIHFGHINVAVEMLDRKIVQEIWFVPTWINPLKQNEIVASAADRFAMLQLATEDLAQTKVVDIELKQEGISYTIDTLQLLKEQFPRQSFALILGEDAIVNFASWKRPEEIIKAVPIYVGLRADSALPAPLEKDDEFKKAFMKGRIPTRILEISSSEIRSRIAKKQYCRHLLPGKVMDYIERNQLYLSP